MFSYVLFQIHTRFNKANTLITKKPQPYLVFLLLIINFNSCFQIQASPALQSYCSNRLHHFSVRELKQLKERRVLPPLVRSRSPPSASPRAAGAAAPPRAPPRRAALIGVRTSSPTAESKTACFPFQVWSYHPHRAHLKAHSKSTE